MKCEKHGEQPEYCISSSTAMCSVCHKEQIDEFWKNNPEKAARINERVEAFEAVPPPSMGGAVAEPFEETPETWESRVMGEFSTGLPRRDASYPKLFSDAELRNVAGAWPDDGDDGETVHALTNEVIRLRSVRRVELTKLRSAVKELHHTLDLSDTAREVLLKLLED